MLQGFSSFLAAGAHSETLGVLSVQGSTHAIVVTGCIGFFHRHGNVDNGLRIEMEQVWHSISGDFLCFVVPGLYFADRDWILARLLASLGFLLLICLGDAVLANATALCHYN